MFSRASACPRQITSKISKRVVQVSWAPTHANSMALLVPVYSVATRFHFLVLLQNHIGFWKLISCSLAGLEFFDVVWEWGMLLVLLGVRLGTQFRDIDLLDSQSLLGSSQERGCSGCSTRTHVVEVEVRNFALIQGTGLNPLPSIKEGNAAEAPPAPPWYYKWPPRFGFGKRT